MKKIISILLIFGFLNSYSMAVEFDSSIDASIRKNYNVEENNLPELPKSIPTADIQEVPPLPSATKATGKIYTLKSGTKINLISRASITDWAQTGSYVSFSSAYNTITKEGYSIPAGTIFKGKVSDSHRPQITGNGGLVELYIDEIHLNGVMSKIDTRISLANSKKVFKNDIKGQRKYWKNVAKVTQPGKKAFLSTQRAAHETASIPVIRYIASPVLWLSGGVIYIVNAACAPVISIFCKGGSVSLPAGTQFQIKIVGDTPIKG